MRLRVLGPVDVQTVDGQILTLARRQERCLLGILLLETGRSVPLPRLADLLWDDNPPAKAYQAIRTYVARIRSVLARAGAAEQGVTLLADRGGYRLDAGPEMVDALYFRHLLSRAENSEPAEREEILAAALALWRGPALQHAATEHLYRRVCTDLAEQHLRAQEELLAAGLELGRHIRLLPELAKLSAAEPLRERFIELHMLALYQQGRSAEALEVYRHARKRIVAALGLDPGVALQQLHRAILRGHPVPMPVTAGAANRVPAQLPRDLNTFTGRKAHLDQLNTLLAEGAGTVVISAIAGTAGIGKTSLAVHWAHLVRDQFPDGQLYLNLRGYDHLRTPLDPAEATSGFLHALGVPAARIPTELDARSALYRSLLADQRMLIVLDNARDEEQVRPLLPGAPTCPVVVTSRSPLTGLVAANGAHPVILDLLTPDEARDLLIRRLGRNRVAAEPAAVEEIVNRCAGLPLALAIVAAHAATRPDRSLVALVDNLRDAGDQLNILAATDPVTDVRTVFSWSYRALTEPAARLFRLLGLHPGPDIGVNAAASLTALPVERASALLAELTRANLLTEPSPRRYTSHNLLRAYAAHLAHVEDSDAQRESATRRLLDYYVHTAHAANHLLDPVRRSIGLTQPPPEISVDHLVDNQAALAWFAIEHVPLCAAVEHAAVSGFAQHSWQLAATLANYFDWRGHWHDWATTAHAALAAIQQLPDPTTHAAALRNVARADTVLRRFDDAQTHLHRALDLYEKAGSYIGQAGAHNELAFLLSRQGNPARALEHSHRALGLYRTMDNKAGQARTLNNVGWYHALLGEHHQALTYCQQALTLLQQQGDRPWQAHTWVSLGYAHQHLGNHNQAITCYNNALTLIRDLGDRYLEALTLGHLGDTHQEIGDQASADNAYHQALRILTDLQHPEVDALRAKLDAVNAPAMPAISAKPGEYRLTQPGPVHVPALGDIEDR